MTGQTVDRADVTRWVTRLKVSVRNYRWIRRGVFAWRGLTGAAFFGLMTLTLWGKALPPVDGMILPGAAFPTLLRDIAASGATDGALITLFVLAGAGWALLPERRYPVLEANALDLRDIDALARALTLPDAEVRRSISQQICPLLSRVQADNAACLSPETRQTLCVRLKIENARADFDLILTILTLLTKIGDDEAMPAVRQLAMSNFRYNAEERVIVAARHCLEILHSRHVKEQERTTLLRPATGNAPAENLLRPANSSETPPELLLRVAEN